MMQEKLHNPIDSTATLQYNVVKETTLHNKVAGEESKMQPNPQTQVFKETITKDAGSIVLWQGSLMLFNIVFGLCGYHAGQFGSDGIAQPLFETSPILVKGGE